MSERPSNRQRSKPKVAIRPLEPAPAYETSMALIRNRFIAIDQELIDETPLNRAERIALHVRKIVEGVAFSCLSGVEHRNQQTLQDQRSKDADKLLSWLHSKQLLRLPTAQRFEPPPTREYKAVLAGAAQHDVDIDYLKSAYSRASSLIHERHPEGLTGDAIASELSAIEEDAKRLRSWLWLHIMFLRGEGFLVQMGQFGSASFMVPLTRQGDLPAEFE